MPATYRKTTIALLAALALVWSMAAPALAQLPEFTELAEKAGGAVVNISTVKTVKAQPNLQRQFRFHAPQTPGQPNPFQDFFDQFDKFFGQQNPRPREQRSLGSGFIISEDGYIVTNNHVVAEADEIKVNIQGGPEGVDAEIVGRDSETDLALIKIDVDKDLPVLEFGDSDAAKVGQWVVAIGNPFGLDHSVTAGIISAKGRIIGSGPFDDFIQTDASINPGNSGGPLLNMDGKVIGINSAIIASGQGIGFAIPSNMARRVIAQIKEGGKVSRGWLGVTIQDVSEDTAKALDMDEPRGALIANVIPDQPADKAGIKAGDVIVEVDGKSMADANELLRTIAGLSPGDSTRLTIWRKGDTKRIKVTLGERDTKQLAQAGQPQQPEQASGVLGMSVRPVTEQEAQALGMSAPKGLLVTAVDQGSPATDSDIRAGDVITQVNQREVATVDEFKEILDTEGKDKGVVLLLVLRQGQSAFKTITLPKD